MEKLLFHYVDSELRLRHAIDEKPNKNDFTMHVHEHYEIYLFISGNAKYIVEGSVYPLEPGTIIIIRPTEIHKAEIVGEDLYERYSINFSTSFLDKIELSIDVGEYQDGRRNECCEECNTIIGW